MTNLNGQKLKLTLYNPHLGYFGIFALVLFLEERDRMVIRKYQVIDVHTRVEKDEEKKGFLNCDSVDRTAIRGINGGICS